MPYGFPAGFIPKRIFYPTISNTGQIAFAGDQDNGYPIERGIWRESASGALERVVKHVDAVSGQTIYFDAVPALVFGVLNDGTTLFHGSTPGARAGVWRVGDDNQPQLLTETDLPDFFAFEFATNASGTTVLRGGTFPPDRAVGLWRMTSSSPPQPAALDGDEAPGLPGRTLYNPQHAAINRAGRIAFKGFADDPTDPGYGLTQVIYVEGPQGLELAFHEGEPPGNAPGRTVVDLDLYSPLAWNNRGDVVTRAAVRMADQNWTPWGIWSRSAAGTVSPVVEVGDAVPELANVSFSSVQFPAVDDRGRVTFLGFIQGASVDETNSRGIWQAGLNGKNGSLIARDGDSAPGGGYFQSVSYAWVNGPGQVLLHAELSDSAGGPKTGDGLFATDRAGSLQCVVRTGELLELPGMGALPVKSFTAWGGSPGNVNFSGFNDRGLISFRATFADGSQGVFLSSLVAVPEPTAATLASLAFILAVAAVGRLPNESAGKMRRRSSRLRR